MEMRNNRNLNIEDLPLSIRIKKYKMIFRYHLRDFWKKIFTTWPIILFVISLVLFFSVLIPNIMLHRLPILGEWPNIFELHGSVLTETNDSNSSRFIGVTETMVEIGGYKSMTDQEGKFYIKFVSKSSTNIPVIIQWSNKVVIKRVSFESNQFEKTERFVINEF
jgi:hypothetical protein